jgi:hypothetical protein
MTTKKGLPPMPSVTEFTTEQLEAELAVRKKAEAAEKARIKRKQEEAARKEIARVRDAGLTELEELMKTVRTSITRAVNLSAEHGFVFTVGIDDQEHTCDGGCWNKPDNDGWDSSNQNC